MCAGNRGKWSSKRMASGVASKSGGQTEVAIPGNNPNNIAGNIVNLPQVTAGLQYNPRAVQTKVVNEMNKINEAFKRRDIQMSTSTPIQGNDLVIKIWGKTSSYAKKLKALGFKPTTGNEWQLIAAQSRKTPLRVIGGIVGIRPSRLFRDNMVNDRGKTRMDIIGRY